MAAIIFRQIFKYKWNINLDGYGYDLFDYYLKPQAYKPELHSNVESDNMEGDFFDYMEKPQGYKPELHSDKSPESPNLISSNEKDYGAFDAANNILSKEQIMEYRKAEFKSQQKGCPKYICVISFENDFLKNNGIMNNYNEIQHDRLKDYARQSVNALIDKSKKLKAENVYWAGIIHEDTDNIHIQFALLEYERLEDRKKKYRDKDMLETEAFEALKSKMVNLIAPQTERLNRINQIEREIAKPNLQAAFTNTDGRIYDLYKKISQSDKPRKWQYGSYESAKGHKADPLKKEIDSVVRNIVQSNDKLAKQFAEFEKQLDDYDKYNLYLYGTRKDIPKREKNYSYNKRDDFYKRAGNTLLQYMRELDISDFDLSANAEKKAETKPERKALNGGMPYLSGEEITNFNGLKEYKLGARYLDNQNDIDLDKAEKYLLLSAEKGNQYAQYRLGKLYLSEEKKNYDKAEKYLLSVSQKGGELSQWADFKLGKLYMTNEKKDYAKAEKHFLLSDRYNNPYAECSLGLLIYQTRSKSEGRAWVKKSVENGNEFAQEILPNLNHFGRSGRRYNKPKAGYVNYRINGMIRRLQSDYERHIKQLQNEYEYETERAETEKKYEYDYIDTDEITR